MVQFADRMKRVSGEAVREILAMMANTEAENNVKKQPAQPKKAPAMPNR